MRARSFGGLWASTCLATFLLGCDSDESRKLPVPDGDTATGGEDASPPGTSADAAADAPYDQAHESDASSADANMAADLFVAPSGLDSNPGTRLEPLKSIATALGRAKPGETVWLLDGVFDATTDVRLGGDNAAPCGATTGIDVPAGVTLAAVTPGTVTIAVSGPWGLCLSGGTVKDIDFRHQPGTGRMIEAIAGENVVEGATFANAYCSGGSGWEAAVSARNESRLTLRPGRDSNFLLSGCTFVGVWEKAEVTLEGGSVMGGSGATNLGAAVAIVRDQGKIVVKGTSLSSTSHQIGFSLAHQATLVLGPETVVSGFSVAGVRNGGDGTRLEANGARFESCGSGVQLPYGYTTKMTAIIANSTFAMNTNGISTGFGNTLDLEVSGTKFTANMAGAALLSLGAVKINGSEFSGNTAKGLELAPQNACKLDVRGSVFANNGIGVNLNCTPASSTLDLGTLTSPGGNTFAGNAPGVASVGGLTLTAVGNTWAPSEQGTNAQGRYEVQGAGAVLEVTGGTGPNHRLASSTMRVAQNP